MSGTPSNIAIARVCFFTEGLDELPRKKQRNPYDVARFLAHAGRFSVFEATANQIIATTMDILQGGDWFVWDTTSCGYPWTKVSLTDAGRAALGREVAPTTAHVTSKGRATLRDQKRGDHDR